MSETMEVKSSDEVIKDGIDQAGSIAELFKAIKDAPAVFGFQERTSFENLVDCSAEEFSNELAKNVTTTCGLREKTLKLLALEPEFQNYIKSEIENSTSVEKLIESVKNSPGIYGSEAFHNGTLLGCVLEDVATEIRLDYKSVPYGASMVPLSEKMRNREFIEKVGYRDLLLNPDEIIIPTRGLGLLEKFINLLEKEELDATFAEIYKLDTAA